MRLGSWKELRSPLVCGTVTFTRDYGRGPGASSGGQLQEITGTLTLSPYGKKISRTPVTCPKTLQYMRRHCSQITNISCRKQL